MPKLAANLTMLFNEVEFLDRFRLAAKAGFTGGRVHVSLRIRRQRVEEEAGRERPRAGAPQSASGQLGQGRPRHRLPSRPDRRVRSERWQSPRVRDGSRMQTTELPGWHPAAGSRREDGTRDVCQEPAIRGAAPRGGGHQIAHRAGQHARHPWIFSRSHVPGARHHRCGRLQQSVAPVRRVPHAGHGGRSGTDHRTASEAHRAHPDRRYAWTPRAGHRRNQLRLPSPLHGSRGVRGLGWLRVQAGHHD